MICPYCNKEIESLDEKSEIKITSIKKFTLVPNNVPKESIKETNITYECPKCHMPLAKSKKFAKKLLKGHTYDLKCYICERCGSLQDTYTSRDPTECLCDYMSYEYNKTIGDFELVFDRFINCTTHIPADLYMKLVKHKQFNPYFNPKDIINMYRNWKSKTSIESTP